MMKGTLVLSGILSLVISIGSGRAEIKTYVIGDDEHPWGESMRSVKHIDDTAESGWIQPVKITRDVNILNQLWREGRLFAGSGLWGDVYGYDYKEGDGRLWSPHIAWGRRRDILTLADGLEDTLSFDYFNRRGNNLGVTIYADLGTPFPVDEVKFYPLHSQMPFVDKYPDFDWGWHEDYYMKGYELWANDGSPENMDENGRPIYHLLSAVPVNEQPVVDDTTFQPQHIRYLKLRSAARDAFEIDQLEIRGEGYLRTATFLSEVIDLGDIANFGTISWVAEKDPGTDIVIQTKVGRDKTALRYFRINDIGEEEELTGATDKENENLWKGLSAKERGRGGIDDTENWSLWSPPYQSPGKGIIASGPRQYIQIRIILKNKEPMTRAKVDNVSFEYSQPAVARRLTGKISPNIGVDLGKPVTFRYLVEPTITNKDSGFDSLLIDTPVRATVKSVKLGGRELLPEDYNVVEQEKVLALRLLNGNRVASDEDSLEVVFDCSILLYGFVFAGRAFASWIEGLPQLIEEDRFGDLAVRASEKSLGEIIGDMEISPNPFTPNGDGVNETTNIYFKVFQVVGTAPVSVNVYGLSGARVRELFSASLPAKELSVSWDGLDDDNNLVRPGLYIVRVTLEGDKERFEKSRTVAVIY
ncbi:MAG TPA: hypothetical protein EYP53_09570 [Candidatus Latescibacteria bacterium]|nr:hypothetical protein [Candidatus Latescibacterota bacterium]